MAGDNGRDRGSGVVHPASGTGPAANASHVHESPRLVVIVHLHGPGLHAVALVSASKSPGDVRDGAEAARARGGFDPWLEIIGDHFRHNARELYRLPEAHFDMVRVGNALFGDSPGPDVTQPVDLKPVFGLIMDVSLPSVDLLPSLYPDYRPHIRAPATGRSSTR